MALDLAVANELRAIHERLDNEGKLLSNAQLDAAFQAFRSRFGPEKLKALDGEDLLLAMHSRGDNNSLVYWLEFKQDNEFPSRQFGSIAGGSAHKFGLFYSQQKVAWIGGNANAQEISLSEAIDIARKQRNEFLAGAEILNNFPVNGSDLDYKELQKNMNAVAPSVGDSAWGHKYFYLLSPEKLDDFHNPDYQRHHLIRLLQAPPEGNGRYLCGGRFVTIAAELGLRMNHLTNVINQRDGGSPYRYWRVGTTEGEQGPSHWDHMKTGGYIGIGWDDIGDLAEVRSNPDNTARKTAIKQLLVQHIPSRYSTEGEAGNAAGEIHRFLIDIAKNDLILAAKGETILGVGRVSGPYYYAPDGRFRHRLPVEWLSLASWQMPVPEQVRSTVRQLWKFPANLLEAEKHIVGAQPILVTSPEPTITSPVPSLSGIPARIENVLTRKGQVILVGPPGTGKTYWAEIAARELAARSWFHKTYDQLSDADRNVIVGAGQQHGGAVRMCSFHPAYGYEDFLEGYRPEAVNGQMVFHLRNGIFKRLCEDAIAWPDRDFFLIIDEINRGDIPRIFGELLTVMERNKRGKTVLLPLTGAPFQVPPNVRIIGTMNTADRSIALLDAALRRRFGFVELMPDSQVLGQANVGSLPLRPWFEALNESVVRHVGRDGRNLQIGHSYLLTDAGIPVSDVPSFVRVLAEDIIPLLQEYCYEDYTALERILGNGLVDTAKQRIRAELFAPDRGDELIEALLAHHPDLATYAVIPDSDTSDNGNILEDELETVDEDDASAFSPPQEATANA